MIIVFEGLSCSGKTTLIKSLKKDQKSVCFIDELPLNRSDNNPIDTNFCQINDEKKSELAMELDSEDKIVLVDRSYVSTLAYEFIKYKIYDKTEMYLDTLNWYFSGIVTGKLIKPDKYVYIDVDEKTALRRASENGRLQLNFAWYTAPKHAIEFYDAFYNFIEPDVPLLKIDGTLSTNVQKDLFWKFTL